MATHSKPLAVPGGRRARLGLHRGHPARGGRADGWNTTSRGCDPCVEYVGQIRATVVLTEQVEGDTLPSDTRDQLIDLYRQWQQPDGGETG